jgi:DUF438 domain-containing protein
MLAQKDFVKVYETLVNRFPWMSDSVKLSIHMKRKDILLLTQMAERGLSSPDLNGLVNDETRQTLKTIVSEMLTKGDLNEFIDGLQDLLIGK